MFNSKARYIYNSFSIFSKVSATLISIVLSVIFILNVFEIIKLIPDKWYLDINNHWMKLLTNTLFFGIIGTFIGFVYLIIGMIIKIKCMRLYAKECKEIIDTTKFPKTLPKVLYVYTSHNDLIEARVLQNKQQTYSNFEMWVSDGSDNTEWRKKIKNFCSKNKINLYQLGPQGSKNKADNINSFLKNYKGDYDYLVIGDADEVFHKNFVEYSIKLFCSKQLKNISYITPLNINYRSKGIYPNTTRLLETFVYWWTFLPRCFVNTNIPPLAGQSCIISKQSLIECNNGEMFDKGNLEDWYLEAEMVENAKFGMMLPNTPCYFEADTNIKAHFNRIMRVNDWIVRWWKTRTKKIIKNYNEKYSSWYRTYFTQLITPLIIISSLASFSFVVWLLANYWDYAFKNNLLFWIALIVLLSFGIITWFINSILNFIIFKSKIFNFWDYFLYPFMFILWVFASNIKVTQHWFKSLFLGKYSEFGGSGKSRFFKVKNVPIQWWISLFGLTVILLSFNLPIFLLSEWWNIKWLIIIFNVYVGSIWMGCLSYLTLWYINFIPYNSTFKREDWIDIKEIF